MSQASGFSLNLAYPMSDPGRAVLGRFAARNREQIAEGDMKAFGNLSAADAMEALSTGSYRGLEGIDFGTSFGRPVAKLPNGAVIQVSAGEMLAAIRKREATRRQVVSKAVEQINRDEFAAENEDVFEAMLENAVALEQISPDTADSYRAFYKMDPMGVLAYVGGVDLADKRQAKTLAAKARTETYRMQAGAIQQAVTAFGARISSDIAGNQENQNHAAAAASTNTMQGIQAIAGLMTAGDAMERSFTPQNLSAFADAVRTLSMGNDQLRALLVRIDKLMKTDDEGYPASRDSLDAQIEQATGQAADMVARTLGQVTISMDRGYLEQVIMQAADPTQAPGLPQRATIESQVAANQSRALDSSFEELETDLDRNPLEGNQRKQVDELVAFFNRNSQELFDERKFLNANNINEEVMALSARQDPIAQSTLARLESLGLVFQDINGNYYATESAARQANKAAEPEKTPDQRDRDRAARSSLRRQNTPSN